MAMLNYINRKRPGSVHEDRIESVSTHLFEEIQDRLTLNTPAYDRKTLEAGIIHSTSTFLSCFLYSHSDLVGVGNFHRAHEAAYLDDLIGLADSYSTEWAILGAGIMPFDAEKREALQKQDFLTTLVERQSDYVSARLVGSMIGFVPVEPPFHKPLQEALLNPAIKIVSLTVTEGGYFINSATGSFDINNAQIKEDAASPDTPKTVFGLIIKALKKRREAGVNPFTIMSCDNIPHNGKIAKEAVVGLASLSDEDLARWISEKVGFPNSMVDRITPVTGEVERNFIRENLGYEDAWPVFCEPYKQWILEDDFPHGRPALEMVGVQFVPDVSPYELMKIRILNGAHAALCYPAALLELKYVHDAMGHQTIAAFLDCLQRNEVIPSVPPVPDTDLIDYWELIQGRFGNPMVLDTVERVCYDGTNRQPKFIVPPVQDNLQEARPVEGLALVSALWCRYCQGKTARGNKINRNDPIWDRLQETARKAKEDPVVWLRMEDIYGEVGKHPKFIEAFSSALHSIAKIGVEKTMLQYVESCGSMPITF